jgi:hypothetical protein
LRFPRILKKLGLKVNLTHLKIAKVPEEERFVSKFKSN